MAFSSPNIPPDILATLLNLVCLYSLYLSAKKIYIKKCLNGHKLINEVIMP